MKKLISLVLAISFVAVLFAGCAKQAEIQKLDSIKVSSVQVTSTGKEIDTDKAVDAFNNAKPGKTVEEFDNSKDVILFITSDGVAEAYVLGENKFVAHSEMFDYAYNFESEELYGLYTEATAE